MLVKVIEFDIHNFTNHITEEYVIEYSPLNYELIAGRKDTRNIRFTSLFDFEFERKANPPKFISFGNAIDIAMACISGIEELDDVDEMVGCDY